MSPVSSTRVASAVSLSSGWPDAALMSVPRNRDGCKCVASVDVGVYGTCGNGCLYCYANQDGIPVGRGSALHDPASPLLVGRLSADDEVTDQRCASLKSRQFSLL